MALHFWLQSQSAPVQLIHKRSPLHPTPQQPNFQTSPSITYEGRRSERIVWLMEELGLPYELVYVGGDLGAPMAKIRAINPDVPIAPTVTVGDQVLIESGATIEVILDRYAPTRLQHALNNTDFPYHLMWIRFVEGSLATRLFSNYRAWLKEPPANRSRLVGSEATVQLAENCLARHA